MLKNIYRLLGNDEGQALVMVALVFTVLLGFVAITIDYGYLAFQRRNLQNAADAAALAGAWELPNEANVLARAKEFAKKNVNELSEGNITIDSNEIPNSKAKVYLEHTYETFFGQILGINNQRITATATAIKDSWYTGILPFGHRDIYENDEDLYGVDDLSEYSGLMEEKIGDNFNLWGKDDEENLKFGLTLLGMFSEKNGEYNENKPVKDVISDGLDKSIHGHDIKMGEGLDHSIDDALKKTKNNKPPGFLDRTGNRGYIIGILPSRAALLDNSEGNDIAYWGEYIILYFENLKFDPKDDNHDDVFLSGTLKAVYNIYEGEYPVEDFYEGKSSRLIE